MLTKVQGAVFGTLQDQRARLRQAISATESELAKLRVRLKATDRDYYTALAQLAKAQQRSGTFHYATLVESQLAAVRGALEPNVVIVSDATHKEFYEWMVAASPPIGLPAYDPDGEFKFRSATLQRADVADADVYFINEYQPENERLNVHLTLTPDA